MRPQLADYYPYDMAQKFTLPASEIRVGDVLVLGTTHHVVLHSHPVTPGAGFAWEKREPNETHYLTIPHDNGATTSPEESPRFVDPTVEFEVYRIPGFRAKPIYTGFRSECARFNFEYEPNMAAGFRVWRIADCATDRKNELFTDNLGLPGRFTRYVGVCPSMQEAEAFMAQVLADEAGDNYKRKGFYEVTVRVPVTERGQARNWDEAEYVESLESILGHVGAAIGGAKSGNQHDSHTDWNRAEVLAVKRSAMEIQPHFEAFNAGET